MRIEETALPEGEGPGVREIYRSGGTPWFGLRLRAGNSLIGARRAVWSEQQLADGDFYGEHAQAPRQLKPGENRKPDEIYHFLVWDEDMAPAARDKLMKSFWPEACAVIAEWQKTQVKKSWTLEQLASARRVCDRIDRLWEEYAKERQYGLDKTRCTASVWPHAIPQDRNGPSLAQQEALKARLEAESGAFQRLRLLMDAWCSLYFWPLDECAGLPGRQAWLAAAEVLLGVGVGDQAIRNMLDIQLGDAIDLDGLFQTAQADLPDAAQLAGAVPWYGVARVTAARQHFHHWELIFTKILGPSLEGQAEPPQGFDLMFGNPPWIKVSWNDAPLLAEFEPKLGVQDAKSATYNRERLRLLDQEERKRRYRDEFAQGEGAGVFLNDRTLYPALAGVQTNLYKNFIERSWGLLGEQGVAGLLHPEGVFDDPRGGVFREAYYHRLLAHYQLKNERILFADVHHVMAFSINIYRGQSEAVAFQAMFNLFDPRTVDQSQSHLSLHDPIPGIKNESGAWEIRGHRQRILTITEQELALFARLFEDAGTPSRQARLPQVHSRPLLKVLERFAAAPRRLGDLKGQYLATEMLHEANAQRDGIITRQEEPSFQPRSADEWVISGPHFFVGTPLNKTPRTSCTANGHYDHIDLTEIPDDYLPRAVYRPGDRTGDLTAFHNAIPEWPRPGRPDAGKGGFWPVSDAERPAWEALLGEPLKRYGIDPGQPGARTARQFGYFVEWQGDVEGAVRWLLINEGKRNSEGFASQFGNVRVLQEVPDGTEMQWLPRPLTAYYRYNNRKRVQSANERTLIPSMLAPGFCHVNAASYSVAFPNEIDGCLLSTTFSSIISDFIVEVTGRGDVIGGVVDMLPIASDNAAKKALYRYVRLVALTNHYSNLWNSVFEQSILLEKWSIDDTRFTYEHELPWADLTPHWQHGCALRSDFARRQALLEVGVLVALALELTCDELIQIYSVKFPVMKAYEQADRYDAKGRRLPNTTRKDAGAKELREALKNHDGSSPVTVNWPIDNGNQTLTKTFYPPFTPVDRIEDYRKAYRVFQERLNQ